MSNVVSPWRPPGARAVALVVGAFAFGALLAPPAMAAPRARMLHAGLRTLGVSADERAALEAAVSERLSSVQAIELDVQPALAPACGRDASCYCAEGRARGAAAVVFGNVGRIEERVSLEMVLVDVSSCAVEGTAYVSEEMDGQGAARAAADLVSRLVRPGGSVTETASKGERDVDAAPAPVVVYTARQLKELGVTRLEELLRLVPGFEVNDLNHGEAVLHGGLGRSILFMIDGVPLTSALGNFSGSADLRLSLAHVARVEIVKAPASVLWGGNALTGIVNLITKSPGGEGERAEGLVRVGTQETAEVQASLGASRPGVAYYVGGTASTTKGPVTLVDDSLYGHFGLDKPVFGNAGATANRPDTVLEGLAKARLFSSLDLLVWFGRSRDHFEITPFGALLPEDEPGFWDRQDVLYSAAWTGALSRELAVRFSASRFEHRRFEDFRIYPAFEGAFPAGVASLQGNEAEPEATHQADLRFEHAIDRPKFTSRLLVGITAVEQRVPDQFVQETDGYERLPRALDIPARSIATLSPYASEELTFLEGWMTLAGGLRLDARNTPSAGTVLVKQGAVLFGPPRARARLVYAEGTRPPTINDLYSTRFVQGNPELLPERSRAVTLEGRLEPVDGMTLRAAGAHLHISDLVLLDESEGDLAPVPVNGGEIDVLSLELEARASVPSVLDGFVAYACKRVEDRDPVVHPIFVAPHTLSAGLSVRPLNGVNLFATGVLVSERPIYLLRRDGADEPRIAPAWASFDVGMTLHNLLDAVDLTLEARNPDGLERYSPNLLRDTAELLERRRDVELLLTLGWRADLAEVLDRLLRKEAANDRP